MFFENAKINDYIVDVNSNIFSIDAKNFVCLMLNICRKIFKIHDCDIENFLTAINDYNEFVSIIKINASLKKKRTIYNRIIFAVFYICDEIELKKQNINI